MEKNYLKKIYGISIAILAIVILETIVLIGSKINFNDESSTTNTTTNDTTTSDYDVSMMNSLTIDQTVGLFSNTKNTYVVYLGRSTCSACVSFLPILQAMQIKYNYTTQYLD